MYTRPEITKILGSKEAIRLKDKISWNPIDGFQVVQTYRGVADAIRAKFNELSTPTSGIDFTELNIDGAAGELICRVAVDDNAENTEDLNAVWELYASPLLKPIEAHISFDTITAQRKRQINRAAAEAEDSYLMGVAMNDTEKILYSLLSHGVLDFQTTQVSLRKSTMLGSKSTITASYSYLNRVQPLNSINPPTALIGALNSLPKSDGSSGAWEWLKLAPQIRQISKRKFQLSYEWLGAERWSKLLYGGSWEPLVE